MLDHSVDRASIEAAKADTMKRHFHTSFQFLDKHYGLRRGCYSVIMGSTGCGKSGLCKPIAVQSATTSSTTKVLVILSEESKEKYAGAMLSYADLTGAPFTQVTFYEESAMDHAELRSHDQFLNALKEVIAGSFADLVIIDNITSSRLYGPATATWDQGKTVWFLKNLAKDMDISLVAVAHTASHVSDNQGRLFTTEDHKGIKALGMEASYFYALQKFTKDDEKYVFVRTLKHRDHPDGHGTYLLKYDKTLGVYVGDAPITFAQMNEIFKTRDHLGK